VNDFLTDFMRRLKSSDRLDGDETSMFRHPLGLLNKTLVARTHNLGASGDRVPVRQQPCHRVNFLVISDISKKSGLEYPFGMLPW